MRSDFTPLTFEAVNDQSAAGPGPAVEAGTVIRLTKLATRRNGENGLTFYYTSDGKNLKEFTRYEDYKEGRWVEGDRGLQVYPSVVPADNYGAAGTTSDEYVVIGYRIPAGGTIDLFTWTALQGPEGEHGYHVKIALGTPERIVGNYDNIGDTQHIVYNTYRLKVREGEMLYLLYEPIVKLDQEWLGFINQLTYTAVERSIRKGDVIRLTDLATPRNGENGLYFYHTSDGRELKEFTRFENYKEGRWIEGDRGLVAYPSVVPEDNYGAAGTTSDEYVAIGYRIPAGGTVDLFTWTALQGPEGEHGYHVRIALGTPEKIVGNYDNIGDTQHIVFNTYRLNVREGEMLYLLYEPLIPRDDEWLGFINQLTYVSVD